MFENWQINAKVQNNSEGRPELPLSYGTRHFNPFTLRKAKIVYNFGLSECNRVKRYSIGLINSDIIPLFILHFFVFGFGHIKLGHSFNLFINGNTVQF